MLIADSNHLLPAAERPGVFSDVAARIAWGSWRPVMSAGLLYPVDLGGLSRNERSPWAADPTASAKHNFSCFIRHLCISRRRQQMEYFALLKV